MKFSHLNSGYSVFYSIDFKCMVRGDSLITFVKSSGLKREIIVTSDGSTTIHIPEWNEQYHSKHGAVQEARHVFIAMGLDLFSKGTVNILEIGFGTGLNCFISYLEADKRQLNICYTGVEAYPVAPDEIQKLNYVEALNAADKETVYRKIHNVSWGEAHAIAKNFELTKEQKYFSEITGENQFNLIYFDAFGARVQPELWTVEIFEIMFKVLQKGGVLVTYCAKGSVRRAMLEVGFQVERLPGPPGKREMLRATKF